MTPKTARERLLRALVDDACTCGGEVCPTPEALADAYAHELAEQQRTFLRSKGTVWTGSIGQVIDHIDPERQR